MSQEQAYYRSVDELDPVLQGDVLRFSAIQSTGFDMCVVLNADCDLVQRKNQGCLVVLPIYTAKQFFQQILVPEQLAKSKSAVISDAQNILRKAHKQDEPNATKPGAAATEKYISADIAQFKSQIVSFDKKTQSQLLSTYNQWHELCNDSLAPQIRLFNRLKLKDKMAKPKSFVNTIFPQIHKEPDDIVRLGPLEGSTEYLHFVYLRQTTILLEHQVRPHISHSSGENFIAVRVCALKDPIRFNLTNRFGQFFSRIGIPEPVEEERNVAIDVLVEELTDELEGT